MENQIPKLQPQKKCNWRIGVTLGLVIFAIAILFLSENIRLVKSISGSWDLAGGNVKYERRIFGLLYKQEVHETTYGTLLKKFGTPVKDSKWVFMFEDKSDFYGKSFLDGEYGRIESKAQDAAQSVLDVGVTNSTAARKYCKILTQLVAGPDGNTLFEIYNKPCDEWPSASHQ